MNQSLFFIVYIVLLGGLWWFFGRKQRERNRQMQEQMKALKAGDHIVTIGGLHGIVNAIDDVANTVELDCEGVYLTFERRAIHHVVPTVTTTHALVTEEVATPETEVEEVVTEEE